MNIVEDLGHLLGRENSMLTSMEALKTYGKDWSRGSVSDPFAVIFPLTTGEVSKIMAYCHKNNIKVVPSGGRTGLAGGCTARRKELVLSLDRMNKVASVDVLGMSVSCEAGVTTQGLQETASEHGLFFPLDLAAKGSSQIGGNIATNAGGLNAIRYGMARQLVLGLEVVLADGQVLDLNSALLKDNTGYDLKQLFIGSEGTLGIITKATLKLSSRPSDSQLLFLGVDSLQSISQVLECLNKRGAQMRAFEFLSEACVKLVEKYHPQLQFPLEQRQPYYLLVDVLQATDDDIMAIFEELSEKALVVDGAIASSQKQAQNFWAIRENISESLSSQYFLRKEDISVPIASLTNFCTELESHFESDKTFDLYLFGHIGDGNIHLNLISNNKEQSLAELKEASDQQIAPVWSLLKKFKGSPSAEHGIGLLKKDLLKDFKSQLSLNLMKKIKSQLDPRNILNPGKIFDV